MNDTTTQKESVPAWVTRARERGYVMSRGRLVSSFVAAGPQMPAIPNHDARQRIGRTSRRVFKRVGSCPRSKLGQLDPWARELWHQQRSSSQSPHYARRDWERFGWLFLWGAAAA